MPRRGIKREHDHDPTEAEAPPTTKRISKRIKTEASKPMKKEKIKVKDEDGVESAEEVKEIHVYENDEIEPFQMKKEMKPYYDRLLKLSTIQEMKELLNSPYAHPLSWYHRGRIIHVHNKMQKNYSYRLDEHPGQNFHPEFNPQLTPGQMLELGVFEGKYCNDQIFEYPKEWFLGALKADKLRPGHADVNVNLFSGSKSRLPLWDWKQRKWIPQCPGDSDVRGWFEWYCRYWLGRRCPIVDLIQIKRWKQFKRHRGQILKNCTHLTVLHCTCRARQRQALLQWAYEPWVADAKTGVKAEVQENGEEEEEE